MTTAGARHCADVNGTFSEGYERGDSKAIPEPLPNGAHAATAPLAKRATMTLDTVAALARICGCTVSEFVARYAA